MFMVLVMVMDRFPSQLSIALYTITLHHHCQHVCHTAGMPHNIQSHVPGTLMEGYYTLYYKVMVHDIQSHIANHLL